MAATTNSEFQFGEGFQVTEEVKKGFADNGYIILKQVLSGPEVDKLRGALESEAGVMARTYGRDDGAGRRTKVVLWNQPGNDLTGVVSRTHKLAGTMEQLLGGEVYHYHAKVIMKEAHTGGKHVWHQDYGYWYENGCVFPHMGTVWVAVDRATRDNGCLQILRGSHLVGRVEHGPVGQQLGADTERVQQVEKFCPREYVELDPGDALFFHSNLLHSSSANSSEHRRWAFLVAYNRADNNPVYQHHHPQYSKLHQLPDSAIMECTNLTDLTGKGFFEGPSGDFSLKTNEQRTTHVERQEEEPKTKA